MELLKSHCSVRKYKADDIDDDLLLDILEDGIRASNTGNMQLYSIIVTKNPDLKNKLAPLHFNQPMIKEAPVVLTVCIDFNRFYKWCEIGNTSTNFNTVLWLLNGVIDVSILSQNICISAESRSLGICYLGTTLYNVQEICNVLNLPKGVLPITTITLGFPEFIPEKADRLPLDSVIHFETYKDYPLDRVQAIYQLKESLEDSKRFVKENSKNNLAQVYAEVRYKTQDSIYFSDKLLQVLKDQGFSFE